MNELESCKICPRRCSTNRTQNLGPCGVGKELVVAKAFLHQWEEPCLSGNAGSGTIFFSGCNLHCVFCQNYDISQENFGKTISIERLSEIMLELQEQGAVNINLVSPTPYVFHIIEAVSIARKSGLALPIVYNTNGYETEETIEMLRGTIDIYLPDIKYFEDKYALKYSNAPYYFEYASKAILCMVKQVGYPVFDDTGLMRKGVLIRHMIMPDMLDDSKRLLRWIKDELGIETYVSLMCQYTPMYKANQFEEINRKLDEWEYDYIVAVFLRLGLENGFVQDFSSATTDYVPNFDLSGI
ncbi:MAG: Radical domain protein [Clostridia bacterium]|nr:Radical domain protein [Clostridia bacterium]